MTRTILGILCLGLAACIVDPPDPADGVHLCNNDGDCAGGWWCKTVDGTDGKGICFVEQSCSGNQDCAVDEVCEGELCRPQGEVNFLCSMNLPCPSWVDPPVEHMPCVRYQGPLLACAPPCDMPGMPCINNRFGCARVEGVDGSTPNVCVPCPLQCPNQCKGKVGIQPDLRDAVVCE